MTSLDIQQSPKITLRVLNHWANLTGSVERGYAGSSLWKWGEFTTAGGKPFSCLARAIIPLSLDAALLDCPCLAWTTSGNAVWHGSISGEVDWQKKTISIPDGTHTVKWLYLKNGSVDAGQDAGWVDEVSFVLDGDADGIPDWWEQQYFGGPTNANPNAICSNGFNTVLQAYIAGFNPNDPLSALWISGPSNGKTIGWNAVSGRLYSVYWATNLLSGFQCLESNIPWTRASFTNQTTVPCGYYKINVRLDN